MNMKQRRAHARIWPVLLILLVAVVGAALIVRERALEAVAAIRASTTP